MNHDFTLPNLRSKATVRQHVDRVRDCLDRYRRPPEPPRPKNLLQQESLEKLFELRKKPTREEQIQRRLFGTWRKRWFDYESLTLSNLVVVLGAIARADHHGLPVGDLRRFVLDEYGRCPRRPIRESRVAMMAEFLAIDLRGFPMAWRTLGEQT